MAMAIAEIIKYNIVVALSREDMAVGRKPYSHVVWGRR
jgi:hypothetical protein